MTDDAVFQLDNLEDLESIELTNDFIEKNIHNLSFKEDHFRQTLNSICESFLVSFLGDKDGNIALLHSFCKENTAVLTNIEKILQTFISQLDSIQADIGAVQESLLKKGTTLRNTLATESILRSAIMRLVIPPEVVQVITQSNEQELGMQFKQCVKELLQYLRHRVSVWDDPLAASVRSHKSLEDHRSLSPDNEAPAVRQKGEVHLSFTECRVYKDLMDFMDSLTLYACWKIKSFLSHKLKVLMIKGTNIWIQQENVLMPSSFYVYFLQTAGPLLKRDFLCPHTGSSGEPSETLPTGDVSPYDLARVLYEEFRSEYCKIMFHLYLKKIQEYVFTCHSMEFNTALPARANVGWGIGAFSTEGRPSAPRKDDSFYALPLITDPQLAHSPELLQLGGRGEIFGRLFSAPLIPVIEKANHRRHSYEETFRSLLSVMCDITTHEYLFAFDFFAGDALVFVEVFRPTIQFVVDYVAEVVLSQGSGEVLQMLKGKSGPLNYEGVEKDTYGLLIMIRLCYEFRSMMRHVRKLYCLDGFFDSLLQLLLPIYNETLERQFAALRSVEPKLLAQAMASLPSTEVKLREVHPIVKSFTTFSSVLMSLLLGLLLSEERYRTEDELYRDKLITGRLPESASFSSSNSSVREASSLPDEVNSSFDKLREVALQRIAEEEEEEAADITGEFMLLASKLEFIRLGTIQLFQDLSQCILAEETNASVREQLEPLQSCFMLNNIYYILQQYHQHPIILTETNPTEGGQEDEMGLGFQREEFLPLDIRDNFHDLQDTYLRYRTEFVERIISKYMPAFFTVIQNGEGFSADEIKEATDSFMMSWQSALDGIVKTVHELISNPENAQQIIAQICMDILLYNTRFHGIIAKSLEKDRDAFGNCPLRSLIVTNQTLLQHMREFLPSVPLTTD